MQVNLFPNTGYPASFFDSHVNLSHIYHALRKLTLPDHQRCKLPTSKLRFQNIGVQFSIGYRWGYFRPIVNVQHQVYTEMYLNRLVAKLSAAGNGVNRRKSICTFMLIIIIIFLYYYTMLIPMSYVDGM